MDYSYNSRNKNLREFEDALKALGREDLETIRDGAAWDIGEFVYYHSTNEWYEKHQDAIWDILDDMQDNYGNKNILDLISSFHGASDVGSHDQLVSLLVRAVVEEYVKMRMDLSDVPSDEDDDDEVEEELELETDEDGCEVETY